MTSALLAMVLVSMLAAGVSDYLYKSAQKQGVPVLSFMALQAIFFSISSYVIIAFLGAEFSWRAALYGMAAGYSGWPGSLLLLRSLKHGDASINVPIFRLSFIITAIGAMLFLAEPARPGKLIAILLAVLSIVLLSNISLQRKSLYLGGLGSLLAGTFVFSLTGLIYKVAMLEGIHPTSIMLVQGPSVALGASIVAAITGQVRLGRTVLRYAPLCGALLCISMFLMLSSLQWGEVSVNVPIVQLSFVVTSVLAFLLLKEKLTTRRALGIAAAVLAVIVFSS